jgi:Undecaprenyl-phosphate galactose phosphotransferase WbaP
MADGLIPVVSALLVFGTLGLYTIVGISPVQEFQRVMVGSAAGYAVDATVLFLRLHYCSNAIFVFALAWVVTILLVPVCREILRRSCYGKPWWGTPTVVFGSGNSVRSILHAVRTQPSLGLKVVAIFDDHYSHFEDFDKHCAYVGSLRSAAVFLEAHAIEHAVITVSNASGSKMEQVIRRYARAFKTLLVIPEVAGISSVWVEPRDLGGVLGLQVHQNLMRRMPRLFKRIFDIVFASLLLVLLLPLFVIIYALIRLSSSGPAFYGQTRIGREGSTFRLWKFRSMLVNADEVLRFHLDREPALRSEWERDRKLRNDPRITMIGRFIRKTSLDELPQLWNVVRGDMSLVGPRPIPIGEIAGYREAFAEIVRYREEFDVYKGVRPGLTGMWQVSGRNNTTYLERVQFDEYYVRNWSIWLDLYILSRTCKTVLLSEGVY